MASLNVVLLVLFCLANSSSCERVLIHVSAERGNDLCQNLSGSTILCHTLERAAAFVRGYHRGPVSISIDNQNIEISSVIKFENVNGIHLVGTSDKTRITCNDTSVSGAGLAFASVNDLVMEDVEFYNCSGKGKESAAIYIRECSNVRLNNITVRFSKTLGLAFFSTGGEILVQNSQFIDNGVSEISDSSGYFSGGAYAEFTKCESNYTFEGCIFGRNYNAPELVMIQTTKSNESHGLGCGGGLGLVFVENACSNNVTISYCEFLENKASFGGGLYIHYYSSNVNKALQSNEVMVAMTNFTSNCASRIGGGVDMGYFAFHTLSSPLKNKIIFNGCQFISNSAELYGGGTAIFASYGENTSNPQETIIFDKCIWRDNYAPFSPAVDIAPYSLDTSGQGFHPIPVFTDCSFNDNNVQEEWENGTKYISTGSFIVNEFTVQFEGTILFESNSFSALKISTGVVVIKSGTCVRFSNNTGIKGGAIALYGASFLHIEHDSLLEFIGNHAKEKGGAIYYQHYNKHEQPCFIQHVGGPHNQSVSERNIKLNFMNNTVTADSFSKSIYATTVRHCCPDQRRSQATNQVNATFNCIANFDFDQPHNTSLRTAGSKFEIPDKMLFQIPGKSYQIPLKITDEFNTVVKELFRVSSKELYPDHKYTMSKNIAVYGTPGQSGRLEFHTLGFSYPETFINVSLLHCPPGFLSDGGKECVCAAGNYSGIEFCSKTKLQAYIARGYWIGYVTEGPVGESLPEDLFTAPCPLGFCSYINCYKRDACILPNTSDSVNEFICGRYRTGKLCGKCVSKRTVYYHSRQYQCGKTETCHFGLLFYFLSEIVPLTILFTVIVVLDFRFTSGTANGFIFFGQVLDSLSVDAKGIIQFPYPIDKLSIGYKIIYGLFNFDFFNIESLSFCLWKQATVLDILAFKYITTVLALGLVIVLVCIIKCCHCKQVCALKQKISTRNSVIHGLSAFLVICYTQCAKISFQILTPVILTGVNGTTLPAITFYGGIPYFGRRHLLYAIPACLCIATLVAIPPLLLLVFPLYFQILAFCGLSESRAANWASRRIWTVRLKPVLDSFQGCFKGKLRFFAGMYFMYRILILAVGTFFKITLELYVSVGVVLVLMLTLHAVAQPYEKRQYNIVDSLIFSNLVIINGCTLYAYKNQADSSKQSVLNALFWTQLVLIYLPLVHICAVLAVRFILKARNYLKTRKDEAAEEQLVPQHEDADYHFIDHELLPYQEFGFSVTESQESNNDNF